MNKLRKILIVPFFGELPPWYDKFSAPDGYSILLDQDLDGFKKRVKTKLGIDFPGTWGSPKVWDYRCALGLLYEEEIQGFDYWGHCDLDVVFGDVNYYLRDEILGQVDVWSGHLEYVCGCFSLYRNVPKVNSLFTMAPEWKENMTGPEPTGWVEYGYSRLLERSGLKYDYTFEQGDPWDRKPLLKREGLRLYQLIMTYKEYNYSEWKEIMFFHFRHSKQNGWPL